MTVYLQKSALPAIVLREVATFPHFYTAFKATMLTQTHVVSMNYTSVMYGEQRAPTTPSVALLGHVKSNRR